MLFLYTDGSRATRAININLAPPTGLIFLPEQQHKQQPADDVRKQLTEVLRGRRLLRFLVKCSAADDRGSVQSLGHEFVRLTPADSIGRE